MPYNGEVEYIELLRNRNFAKLWFAQILAQIGQNLLNFSLIILVFDLAAGSRFDNISVSLLVLSFSLPPLFFANLAGAYVDYWDRKWVLVITNILRGILVLGYLVVDDHFWLVLLLTFVITSIVQMFFPAETATIPNLVPKRLLLPANSLFIFTLYASFLIGYSGSGPAIQAFGEHGPYEVVAGMMILAALLTLFLPAQGRERPDQLPPRPHIIRDITQNWALVREHPDRFFSILQLTITQGMVSVLITLAPALSKTLLHIPLQQASHVLIIPVGVGMVMGVLLINVLGKTGDKTTIIQGGLIIAGISLTALGFSAQLYHIYSANTVLPVASIALIVGVLMFILGMINAMISAAAQTLLQESTSDGNRGKVFASLNMMINLAASVPILFAGVLADLLSVTHVIVLMGVLLTGYAIYMSIHFAPQIKRSP